MQLDHWMLFERTFQMQPTEAYQRTWTATPNSSPNPKPRHNSTTNLSKSKQLWLISKPKPRRRATKRQSREAKAELERKLKKITQESDNYSKDIEDLEKERAKFKKDADDLSDKLEVEKKVRAQKDARIKRLEGACRMQQPHLLHPFFISSGSTTTPNAMLVAEIAWQRTNWRYCLLR